MNDTYLYELARLWPDSAILQSSLLLIVWIHGCIGIHFWLRLYAPYRRFQPILAFLAIIIPIAALGGFMVGGRAVAQMISDPKTFEEVKQLSHWPSPDNADRIAAMRLMVKLVFAAMLATALGLLIWPSIQRRYFPHFIINYVGTGPVNCTVGPTLLEISRMNRVPHASVCGGPRPMLHVPRSYRQWRRLDSLRDLPGSRNACEHRCAAERPSRLPNPAPRSDDRHPATATVDDGAVRCG